MFFSVLSICSAMYSRNIDLELGKYHFDIRIFKQKMNNLILDLLSPAVKTSYQSLVKVLLHFNVHFISTLLSVSEILVVCQLGVKCYFFWKKYMLKSCLTLASFFNEKIGMVCSEQMT